MGDWVRPVASVEHDMILKEIVPGSLAEYGELKIPQSVKESYDPEHAQELFRVNCSVLPRPGNARRQHDGFDDGGQGSWAGPPRT